MTDLIYEQFAKNYLKEMLSPYVQVEVDRQVVMKREETKEEDSYREFAKGLFSAMLSPHGTVEIEKELPPPEPEKVPVYATLGNTQITDELGLLKKCLNKDALFYPLFHEVDAHDIRHCLYVTLILFQEYHAREERYEAEFQNFIKDNGDYVDKFKEGNQEDEDDEYEKEDYSYQEAKDYWIIEQFYPRSWVLIPTADESLLEGFRGDLSEDWVKGVYFLAPAFRMQIIVIDELPKTYETLWLRLLTKGKVLLEAIDEVVALPVSNILRFKAINALMTLRVSLEGHKNLDAQNQDLVERLSLIYKQEIN
jgi:hypothetical protein